MLGIFKPVSVINKNFKKQKKKTTAFVFSEICKKYCIHGRQIAIEKDENKKEFLEIKIMISEIKISI